MGFTGTEVTLFLVGQVIVAAGIWGGIRADLRAIHMRVAEIKSSADAAHKRLDDLLLNGSATTPPHYRRPRA